MTNEVRAKLESHPPRKIDSRRSILGAHGEIKQLILWLNTDAVSLLYSVESRNVNGKRKIPQKGVIPCLKKISSFMRKGTEKKNTKIN